MIFDGRLAYMSEPVVAAGVDVAEMKRKEHRQSDDRATLTRLSLSKIKLLQSPSLTMMLLTMPLTYHDRTLQAEWL